MIFNFLFYFSPLIFMIAGGVVGAFHSFFHVIVGLIVGLVAGYAFIVALFEIVGWASQFRSHRNLNGKQ